MCLQILNKTLYLCTYNEIVIAILYIKYYTIHITYIIETMSNIIPLLFDNMILLSLEKDIQLK